MITGVGGLLMLVCIIWFVVLSIQSGGSTGEKIVWVVVNLLFQPLGGLIFFVMKKQGLVPLILGLIGVLLYGYGFFTSIGDVTNTLPR